MVETKGFFIKRTALVCCSSCFPSTASNGRGLRPSHKRFAIDKLEDRKCAYLSYHVLTIHQCSLNTRLTPPNLSEERRKSSKVLSFDSVSSLLPGNSERQEISCKEDTTLERQHRNRTTATQNALLGAFLVRRSANAQVRWVRDPF